MNAPTTLEVILMSVVVISAFVTMYLESKIRKSEEEDEKNE